MFAIKPSKVKRGIIIHKGISFREIRGHNGDFRGHDTVLVRMYRKLVLSPDFVYQNASDSEGFSHEHSYHFS